MTNNSQSVPVLGYYLLESGLRFRATRPPVEAIDLLWSWARDSDAAGMLLFYAGGTLPAEVA